MKIEIVSLSKRFLDNLRGSPEIASSSSPSVIISSIQSALMRVDMVAVGGTLGQKCWEKIGLRNLKVLLLCLRKVDNDDDDDGALHLVPLFSRIEDFIARLVVLQNIQTDILEEVHSLGEEADGELQSHVRQSSSPFSLQLEVDEVVGIADSVLENAVDFLSVTLISSSGESTDAYEVLDALKVHMTFMKSLLLFAMRSGVEINNSLMLSIQPHAINAANVFVQDTPLRFNDGRNDYHEWYKYLEPKCLAVNGMATDCQLYQAYAKALTISIDASNLRRVDDDVFNNLLDSLISLLWDLLRRHADYRAKDQLKVLYERLRLSRAILKKNIREKNIRGQIGVLVRDAGSFIFSAHQTDHSRLSDLLQKFDVFQAQVKVETIPSFKANAEFSFGGPTNIKVLDDGNEKDLERQKEITPTSSHQRPQSWLPQVVGFKDDEVTSILDRLTRGSRQLRIVPISGMAGIGKTTFALKLYNHSSIIHHFQARAWCPISQVLDKKKVLLQLLNQIYEYESNSMFTEDDLANKLRQSLKKKRYLILLDDVWTPEVWNDLRESFPNDSTQSRVILTSRCLDIVPHALPDQPPHLLRLREDNECFEILQSKLFHKEGWTPELGMKIAEKCKGLPLIVVIVAGLLATRERENWKGILDHLRSGSVSGAERALELSFHHFPHYLQPCFLYFGAFPEDEEVCVKRLIRLWMAEGFVRKSEAKRIEDVAREYLEKLIERSLVMVVKDRSIGGVSTCRVHDLLHEFCRIKMKQEKLFHVLLERNDELLDFREPCDLRRLSILSCANHFKESELFCPSALSMLFFSIRESGMESRLLDMSFIIQVFRLLKVLDIYQIILTNGMPSEIQLLTQLRYLSIRSDVGIIPFSVGNLFNLEVLIACFQVMYEVSFPYTLWKLQKLKYLHIKSIGGFGGGGGFTLPIENSSSLPELETLDGVVFSDDGSVEEKLRMFPNIRSLKCRILGRGHAFPSLHWDTKNLHKILVSDFPSQLESVTLRGSGNRCEFGSRAENLRKLKLWRVEMCKEDIAVIGKFPNLEVLNLTNINFAGNELEMEEYDFPKLRILKLVSSMSLKRWTSSDDQLPCMQKLVIRNCTELEEIPSFLETSPTLEEIRVVRCSSTLESVIRHIEQVQEDFGNLISVEIY